ncbi:MAG: UV DNA damage repair endonuclease UvsE [Caldilineaceae bacterium]|nr:UV DNA damage repair endonuclease UvsE [Caldilineaceae bacterium]
MTSTARIKETVTTLNGRRPHLGLVCITASDEVRYRTITRTWLLQFKEAEQRDRLRDLYAANIVRLELALDFCIRHQIGLYRITSDLFPFADSDVGEPLLAEFAADLARLGQKATEAAIRMVMHPDQFVVISSESPSVVENSIGVLAHHAQVLDLLGQPRSSWALLEIHGGKSKRADALIDVIGQLPHPIRSRLALENDESAYSAAEILAVCKAAGVPMVFDAHHHIVKEKLESYEHPSVAEMVLAARETWPDPAWQLVHISNGREHFQDRRHSDLIEIMPESYRSVPWIEVEAKQKEVAIAKLRAEWE